MKGYSGYQWIQVDFLYKNTMAYLAAYQNTVPGMTTCYNYGKNVTCHFLQWNKTDMTGCKQ